MSRPNIPVHQIDNLNAIPTTWNWTAQGVVPDVSDQGSCGDCYAWSSMEAVESSLAIKNNGTSTTGRYTGDYFSV